MTTTRPNMTIVNCQTNETVVREMTTEEFAQYKKQQEAALSEEATNA